MSFFEDDEPTTVQRQPRPRRSTPPRRPSGGSGGRGGSGGGDVDAQTLRTRRLVAGGGGLLVLIILILLVNACQNSRHKNALRDWNRQANQLVTQSDGVGQKLFETLGQGSSQSPEDLQSQVSGLRADAATELRQAKDLGTPGDLDTAQQSLLIALELRKDALQYVSERVARALGNEGDQADEAITQITGQMQAFLASDVLIRARVTTSARDALSKSDVVADPVSTEGFLPNYQWLQPSYVADQLGTRITGGGGSSSSRNANTTPAPGLHGTGLTGTTVGDTALQPDPASNRVPLSDARTFSVQFANQGENDETDIPVSVTLQGSGRPITGRTSVDSVAQGATATATVKLPSAPQANEVYTVTVKVDAVPGEKKTDNNKSTYNVLFE